VKFLPHAINTETEENMERKTRQVQVPEDALEMLQKMAEAEKRSLPQQLGYIIEAFYRLWKAKEPEDKENGN
jgi:hypothetical protein